MPRATACSLRFILFNGARITKRRIGGGLILPRRLLQFLQSCVYEALAAAFRRQDMRGPCLPTLQRHTSLKVAEKSFHVLCGGVFLFFVVRQTFLKDPKFKPSQRPATNTQNAPVGDISSTLCNPWYYLALLR